MPDCSRWIPVVLGHESSEYLTRIKTPAFLRDQSASHKQYKLDKIFVCRSPSSAQVMCQSTAYLNLSMNLVTTLFPCHPTGTLCSLLICISAQFVCNVLIFIKLSKTHRKRLKISRIIICKIFDFILRSLRDVVWICSWCPRDRQTTLFVSHAHRFGHRDTRISRFSVG